MSIVNLKQLVRSGLRDSNISELLKQDNFSYKSIFLNRVKPDPTNARYFPAIVISDNHANQFARRYINKRELIDLYKAEDRVLVGKSCFINCATRGSQEWKLIDKNIENILSLAQNIERSEVIQAPTLYPDLESDDYVVVTGHRRVFAMIYCYGADGVAQFKVYDSIPLLKKTKQFQENASREDLPQHGKLVAFINAKEEVELVSQATFENGGKKLTVRDFVSILGISSGTYDNYNVLTRYPSVINAYENGLKKPFVMAKKIVLDTENQHKTEHQLHDLNVNARKSINTKLKHILAGEPEVKNPQRRTIKFKPISQTGVVKQLLTQDVTAFDSGVDWHGLDWSNVELVNQSLVKLIDHLESLSSKTLN